MSVLKGQVALVTGCGRMQGIGRAVALELARAGADVVVSDIVATGHLNVAETNEAETSAGWKGLESVVAEVQATGRRSHAVFGDVGDEADANRLVAETVEAMGRLDILVNNAGAPHGSDRGLTWEIPAEGFDKVMRINTRGVFLMSAAAVRHMLGRKAQGRIINIASGVGKRGLPERAAYTASKFAAIGITQTMAQELGAHDITVNAICPGLIATARHASRLARQEAGVKPPFIEPAVPRVGTPEDIARSVLFLAEPAASFITGQAFNVDGGALMH